jgi:hypothetical protein
MSQEKILSFNLSSTVWVVFLVASNIVLYNYYWIMTKDEVLNLNWIHELIVMALFIISIFFSVGSLLTLIYTVKKSGWTNSMIYNILYVMLGIPLFTMTSWIVYLLRTKMYQ